MLGAGSADGTRLPPFIVYKGKNLWARWMQGGPAASMYTVSDSGWMEGDNFLQWFQKMFLPSVKSLTTKYPIVLFFDGHHSHLTMDLIKLARENNIHLICFPPHCTHILQPLDVSVFSPVKDVWRKILKEYQLGTCAATVTKEDFPRLISKLWEISFLPGHLRSGFLKCGLCPLRREAISSGKLSKALPHKKPSTEKGGRNNVTGESSSSSVTGESPSSDVTGESPSSDVTGESPCSDVTRESPSSDVTEESPSSDGTRKFSSSKTKVVINLTGECTVNSTVTPIRLHLRGYFSQLLQKNKLGRRHTTNKQKLKPKFYGEALTLDEFFNKISEEEEKAAEVKKAAAEKKALKRKAAEQKAAKQKKAAGTGKSTSGTRTRASEAKTPVPSPVTSSSSSEAEVSSTDDDGCCEECGGCYKDDDQATRKCWMGCDSCERWFHCSCVGLRAVPKRFWSCKFC